ncbi:MAG: ECF transporter S component [Candidatus Thorarchaeota archaeon]
MEYFIPRTSNTTVYVAFLAVLTALTTIATMVIAIPFPTSTGFLNFGDTLVMLSGLLLGPLGGFIAGGVGSAMGDVFLGYLHFAPITLVVKGCEGLAVGLFSRRAMKATRLTQWDIAGILVASFIMLTGYFLAEIPLVGLEAAMAELLFLNVFQVAAGSIVTILVGPVVRNFVRDYLREADETVFGISEHEV